MVADARPAGRWEPAELGVHPVAGSGTSRPAYIRRPHDETLRTMLDPEVAGSRLIVIRGDAGTGKSRAAYEAVAARLGDWSLEYPPTAAALAARLDAGIPAWTVLWLGELRRYAGADGGGAAPAMRSGPCWPATRWPRSHSVPASSEASPGCCRRCARRVRRRGH